MESTVHIVTAGALLHDIGKVLHRAGGMDGRAHSRSGAESIARLTGDRGILDCIRYHHRQELDRAAVARDSPAYLVYIADNISAGADRREVEGEPAGGFDKNRPLESVFNLLNNRTGQAAYRPVALSGAINYPDTFPRSSLAAAYGRIAAGFAAGLSGVSLEPEYINSLLELCEAYLSFIPSSTFGAEVSDISLFDHSKTTAALAACIALYLAGGGRKDYRAELFEKEAAFLDEKAFLLFSLDISGIQPFIYTITAKGALKGLRSRSFYLEILLENTADEILAACCLSRANLIYTGGGHAYFLLPNTAAARRNAAEAVHNINRGLLEHFGAGLFIACGGEACSANELMSKTDDPESYSNIFRSVSAQIAAMKLRRYSPDDIRRLNAAGTDKEGRECAVCGAAGNLRERAGGDIMCETCAAFADISGALIQPDCLFAVRRERGSGPVLPLFAAGGGDLFLSCMTAAEAKEYLKRDPGRIARLYSKNEFRTGLNLATRLWMGDYAARDDDGALQTFAALAGNSAGIERIGVLRADVDSLGAAFVSGFVRENETGDKYRYVTISRTATLSRSLSVFFKYHVNRLLAEPDYSLTGPKGRRSAVIVYSGGDDMFLVGAWDEVLAAAVDIRRAFARYTGGALTLSAGFAVFDVKYPLARMADETRALEEKAKRHAHAGGAKNSISLFGLEMESGYPVDRHTYDWDTFEAKVLGEKYAALRTFFTVEGGYGSSFLYNLLYFLREAPAHRINIARLAYLLARREPAKEAPAAIKAAYADFAAKLYRWALAAGDRRQLITALLIYVYTMRDAKGERENG